MVLGQGSEVQTLADTASLRSRRMMHRSILRSYPRRGTRRGGRPPPTLYICLRTTMGPRQSEPPPNADLTNDTDLAHIDHNTSPSACARRKSALATASNLRQHGA